MSRCHASTRMAAAGHRVFARRWQPGGARRARVRRAGAATAAALALLAGCAEPPRSIQQQAEVRWDDYRAAVKHELANEELRSGNTERAIALAREIGALSPDNPAHVELLARSYVARGDFGAARQVLEPARLAHPEHAAIHYLAGVVYQRDADWQRAAECYRTASVAAPQELDYHLAYAHAVAQLAPERAVHLLEERADAFAFEPAYHVALGDLHQRLGAGEEASGAYRRAIELGAEDRATREKLALCLLELGRHAEALRWFEALLGAQEAPSQAARLGYAACLLHTGQARAAADALEKRVAADGGNPGTYLLLARARAELGEAGAAEEAAATAAALAPESAEAHTLLATLRLGRGDVEGAATAARRAVEVRPDDPDAYLVLGRACELRADPTTAAQMYRAALRIEPQSDLAAALLARVELIDDPSK